MQPKIIKKDTLHIIGLTGDGGNTGEVWNEFDRRYKENPFPKADENGYEIRFYDGEKSAPQHGDIHVGFLTKSNEKMAGFDIAVIPATEYAIFDVYVAKGYDSGNAEMDNWLADNAMLLKGLEIKGNGFIIEHYNEKFKDGDKPDSIVEMWLPFYRFCQSCYMPMTKSEKCGTEADGSPSRNYCCYCYTDGNFITKQTLEEAVEDNIQFWRKDGDKSDDEARVRILEVFPKLKRWAIGTVKLK